MNQTSVWEWRGQPSVFTATEPKKPRVWQASQGSAFPGNGLTPRMELDTAAMLEMHLAGSTWREVGAAHGCCAGTAQKYTSADFPHRVIKGRRV